MWSPLRSLDAAYSPRPFQATTRCHSVLECHSSSAPFQDAESPAKEPHTCGLTPSQTCAPGFCRDNGLISRFRIDAVYYCSGEHSASELPHETLHVTAAKEPGNPSNLGSNWAPKLVHFAGFSGVSLL